MGILNVTSDSFSDGGLYPDTDSAVRRAEEMISQGAEIIDVGGESTRPGASPALLEEEINRVIPVIQRISSSYDVTISVDTRKAAVAAAAYDAGANIINDVSGFSDDMLRFLASSGMPAVLMHSLWDPEIMQRNVTADTYQDIIKDILVWTENRIAYAESLGVKRKQLIFDPGIGFGKLPEHNLEIIRRCGELKSVGMPLLIAASRKNFIGLLTGKVPQDRLGGSLAVAAYVYKKADLIRVHDVKETADLFCILDSINNS